MIFYLFSQRDSNRSQRKRLLNLQEFIARLSMLSALSVALTQCGPAGGVPDASTDAGASWYPANTAGGSNVVVCRVGSSYTITCNPACGGGVMSCANDPLLVVCDGSQSESLCIRGMSILARGDDSCGNLCPSLILACPPSGSFLLMGHEKHGGIFYCIPTVTLNM
jgi:hypothetical protein